MTAIAESLKEQGRVSGERDPGATVQPGMLDGDEALVFRLRGYSLNPLVDAASPLFGLVIRVRQLEWLGDSEALYRQVVEEIRSIDIELTEQGYDRPTVLAYRYVLCSFVDEAVMSTSWGAQSDWAEHSLLARFHDETWGGEKVFSILARLQQEPQRYEELLTFIYVCLCLGFEGRYRIQPERHDEYQRIVKALGDQLSSLHETSEEALTDPERHVTRSRWNSRGEFPVWMIVGLFAVVSVGLYLAMSWSLGQQASEVSALVAQWFEQKGN